jgi:hypothetical protein
MWPVALEDPQTNPLGNLKCSMVDAAVGNKELYCVYGIVVSVMEPILWKIYRNKSNEEKQGF